MLDKKRYDQMTMALLHLFKNKIQYYDLKDKQEKIVRIFHKIYPNDIYPNIVIYTQGGLGQENPLINTDYNEDGYPIGYHTLLESKRRAVIDVQALDKETLDSVYFQIEQLIDLAKNHHFLACCNFNPTTTICETSTKECDGITINLLGRCPYTHIKEVSDPNYRNPINIFQNYGIDKNSISPRSPQDLKETDAHPPLYRYVLEVDFIQFNISEFRHTPITKVVFDDENEFL